MVDTNVVDLLDTRFAVGEAVFEGMCPRPHCAHVEAVASEDGLAAALSAERGGICADVVAGDTVAVDDDLRVVEDWTTPTRWRTRSEHATTTRRSCAGQASRDEPTTTTGAAAGYSGSSAVTSRRRPSRISGVVGW